MFLFHPSIESKANLPSNYSKSGKKYSQTYSNWFIHAYFLKESVLLGIFREAIWPFLVIGQFFGVLPVIGVRSPSLAELQFKWESIRTFYSLAVATLLLSYSLFVIWQTCNDAIDISSICKCNFRIGFSRLPNWSEFILAALVFYVLNTYAYISLLDLARKWPKLMKRWDLTESILPHFRYQRQHAHFIWKIRFISIAILLFAFCIRINRLKQSQSLLNTKSITISVEHFFYVGAMFHFITTVGGEQDPLTFIVENSVPYTFSSSQTQPVPIWVAIPINFISITSTFVWNYLDALILVISIGLSTLFQLFNDELRETQEVHVHVPSF